MNAQDYIAERDADARERAATSARIAQKLAERMFPGPAPDRLWPEERMLMIIGAATLAACLLGWL